MSAFDDLLALAESLVDEKVRADDPAAARELALRAALDVAGGVLRKCIEKVERVADDVEKARAAFEREQERGRQALAEVGRAYALCGELAKDLGKDVDAQTATAASEPLEIEYDDACFG